MASPEEMAQTMRDNIEDKTGKPIAEWFDIIAASSMDKHGQIVKYLKAEFAVTHGFANLITSDFLHRDEAPAEENDLISAQYAGAKSGLKTIYNTIIEQLTNFTELEIAPKKTYVSLRRNKQFAIIQPSTKTRVDVGINLKGVQPTDRLEAAGSFNSMVTHRVKITELAHIDRQLVDWLQQAYDLS